MLTTVCYLEKDNKYLMLHRVKKENDINKGKWIGVGGKFEKNETPIQCAKREIKEETGYDAEILENKGLVIFKYNNEEPLYMYIYVCKKFSGEQVEECEEGNLKWVEKNKILNLNLWEGDKIFLELLEKEERYFYLTLEYENDKLIKHHIIFREEGFINVEVFVPEKYVDLIVENLDKYNLLTEGCYRKVYASIDVEGHWTTMKGANPFSGEVGKESCEKEKLLKFRVKKEFKELVFYLIKEKHPYEVPVINFL